jgi:outer membrane protein TolC
VDLIITLGFGASQYAGRLKQLKKPVIASAVVDAEFQGLPEKDGTSGVKNLNYISPLRDRQRGLKAFREIVPFKNLAFLVDRLFAQTIPKINEIEELVRQTAVDAAVLVYPIVVDTSADEALAALPPETDAVFVAPLIRLSSEEFQEFVAGLIERKLPSFSVIGRDEVEQGLLVSVNAKSNIPRFARRIALNVQRVLLGEDAGSLKVAFPSDQQLTINMATARAIGVYPTWSVLTEAELLNEEPADVERRLSLDSAVREAIAVNLDLAVQEKNVAAGKQAIRQVRSRLLPQIDLEAGGVIIDDDRATAGRGANPERTFSGSATATQRIYDDEAWSDYKVEKHRQTSREEEHETVRLDIALDAAVAYLNVLRAKTLERIQKDNLKLTRANLERAHARESIGVASRAEVFRWESEIANKRQDVLAVEAQRRKTENALNRLLHRPLEERFATEEADLEDPLLLVSNKRFFNYVDNPRSFRIFRDFLVEEGLAAAPEIRRIDAAAAAQERILTASKRGFWLPTFSLQGGVTELFDDSGEGTRDQAPTGLNNTDWSVGVFANFPLVKGGQKFATIKRARAELSGLRLERQATAERIEERIRSAVHETGASYPSIRLSYQAAEAAGQNLKLVTDSYTRGVVSIIDLLDAQNAALVADQAAENAVYNFLVDLMGVQRAAGQFDFFLTPEEREAWFQRLDEYFQKADVAPRNE